MKALYAIMLLLAMFTLRGADPQPPGLTTPAPWVLVSDIFLGVKGEALTPEEIMQHGATLPPGQGLKITRVVAGSPAEKSGLRPGDLLLMLNGCQLSTPVDLLLSLRHCKPGIPVFIDAMRDGKPFTAEPVIAARPHPVAVGRIVPHARPSAPIDKLEEHQARAAELLIQAAPPLAAVRAEMDALSNLIGDNAKPGNLRLYYTQPDCTITVTKLWQRIIITMVENGKKTSCELRNEGDTLPESMRQRLREMLEPKNTQP